jgi:hypothetical protein
MTRLAVTALSGTLVLALGCHAPHPTAEHDVGVAENKYLNDTAIGNAIIAQRTLYPYHFIPDAPTVNELGEHDLGVLTEHFKRHPGKLNVRRGATPEDLYQSRVDYVAGRLSQAGVNLGPIEDGSPGGEGMLSERVLTVLEKSYEKEGQGDQGGDMGATGARAQSVNRTRGAGR